MKENNFKTNNLNESKHITTKRIAIDLNSIINLLLYFSVEDYEEFIRSVITRQDHKFLLATLLNPQFITSIMQKISTFGITHAAEYLAFFLASFIG